MMFPGIVSGSLSPNAEHDDVLLAFRTMLSPRKWVMGSARLAVEKWFNKYLGNPQVLTFNSGRSALFVLLRAFGIGVGDEVLIQSFTCVAVANSVIWAGAKPVYVDIDKTLNMDPCDLPKKITSKTRALIVQHTFGVPADMDAIMAFARKHKLLLFEDCAHSLGARYNEKNLGTLGDGAIFSFGRDKVVSSVFGGLASVSPGHLDAWKRLKELHGGISYPTGFWIAQQLFHPVAFSFILPAYRLEIGKLLLWVLQQLRLLGFPVYPEERQAHRPAQFPRKYPNALAVLLLNQLKKLDRYTKMRHEIADLYRENLKDRQGITLLEDRNGASYLRFPILVDKPAPVLLRAKRRGLLLGNWYHNVIDPKGVSFTSVQFHRRTCPRAEEMAAHIINLPTRISKDDAMRIVKNLLHE